MRRARGQNNVEVAAHPQIDRLGLHRAGHRADNSLQPTRVDPNGAAAVLVIRPVHDDVVGAGLSLEGFRGWVAVDRDKVKRLHRICWRPALYGMGVGLERDDLAVCENKNSGPGMMAPTSEPTAPAVHMQLAGRCGPGGW